MSEQLQQELAAWLAKLREAADAGGSFVLEQAPLIVQERIAYGRFIETFELAAAITGAVLLALASWFLIRASRNSGYDNPPAEISAVFSGFGAAAMAAIAVGEVSGFAQVWFAPRIYVMEWLAGLLR